MPTRPRIDFAGYHHIINRGVNRCDVFNQDYDRDTFLAILNKAAIIHKVILQEKVGVTENTLHVGCEKPIEEDFYDIKTKFDRNLAIINAFLDGYTQANIALYLNLSKSLVSKVIKSGDSTSGVYRFTSS